MSVEKKNNNEVNERMQLIMRYDRLFASFVGKIFNEQMTNSYSWELERKMIGEWEKE